MRRVVSYTYHLCIQMDVEPHASLSADCTNVASCSAKPRTGRACRATGGVIIANSAVCGRSSTIESERWNHQRSFLSKKERNVLVSK
jgi:hypothetical protein